MTQALLLNIAAAINLLTVQQVPDTIQGDFPPYSEVEVVFQNGQVTLAGTLTMPDGSGRHPAVVMVTGSGAQNRDQEVFGFKPFRMIADHLSRNGIAVLRYDDRGVGGSSGELSQSTTEDFAEDVIAAVEFLKTLSAIDEGNIGVVGHSEGGLVAPLAASRSEAISFIVMLAGPALRGEEILRAQTQLINEAEGKPASITAQELFVLSEVASAVKDDTGWDALRDTLVSIMETRIANADFPTPRGSDVRSFIMQQVDAQLQTYRSPWFRFFLIYEPEEALEALRIPVLALFGELDLQVPPHLNAPAMEAALERSRSPSHLVTVIPGVNHLFLPATNGSPREYATIPKEFEPQFLDLMTTWILAHIQKFEP